MLCSNTPMPAWVRVARPNKRRVSRQHRPKVCHAGNLMQNAMTKFLDVHKKWKSEGNLWSGQCDYSLVAPIRQTASIFKQPVTVFKEHKSKVVTFSQFIFRLCHKISEGRPTRPSSSWFCCWLLDFSLCRWRLSWKLCPERNPHSCFGLGGFSLSCLLPSHRTVVCLMCRRFITNRLSIFGIWFTHSSALLILL